MKATQNTKESDSNALDREKGLMHSKWIGQQKQHGIHDYCLPTHLTKHSSDTDLLIHCSTRRFPLASNVRCLQVNEIRDEQETRLKEEAKEKEEEEKKWYGS